MKKLLIAMVMLFSLPASAQGAFRTPALQLKLQASSAGLFQALEPGIWAKSLDGRLWYHLPNNTDVLLSVSTDLDLKLALTGGTLTGSLLFSPDGTYDIGANGATRPRNGYFSSTVSAADPTLSTHLATKNYVDLKLSLTGGTLTGSLLFSPDGTYDIGANGATRPRNGYFSSTVSAADPTLSTHLATKNYADLKLALTGGTLTGSLLFSPDGTNDIGANGATRPRNGYFSSTVSAADPTLSTHLATKNYVDVNAGTTSQTTGDGSDGVVDFDGTNTYAGFTSTTGSSPNLVYTLTRDAYPTTFTVEVSKTLLTHGFRIFVQGTATVNGTVSNNGTTSANSTGGAGATASGGTLCNSGANCGTNGGSGSAAAAGGNGSAGSTGAWGGQGASGGATGGNAGGTGGAISAALASTGSIHEMPAALLGYGVPAANIGGGTYLQPFWGGTGGGAGGAAGGSAIGGGGGGGGGGLVFMAKLLVMGSAGLIQTVGGNGGPGSLGTGTGAGGGGGGGGGWLTLGYGTLTDASARITAAHCVAGGSGGALAGTGAAGNTGNTGTLAIFH